MSFDPVARWFGPLERLAFGDGMQRAREAATDLALEDDRPIRRALFVGDGDGRGALALAERRPDVELWLVDASAEFLARAESRLTSSAVTAHYLQAELPGADPAGSELPTGSFDLIATHFFLDCFEGRELARVIAALTAVAAPDARWIVSDFHVPDTGCRRHQARAWLAILYPFFGATAGLNAKRLEDPGRHLRSAGWAPASPVRDWRLWRSSLWQGQR